MEAIFALAFIGFIILAFYRIIKVATTTTKEEYKKMGKAIVDESKKTLSGDGTKGTIGRNIGKWF